MQKQAKQTERALGMLKEQLDGVRMHVPKKAVTELQKVRLYLSPEYASDIPRAAYHPGAEWLKQNGRDPKMAKGVEFTNVRIFAAETRRMPNFVLHELAHAYHDQVLPQGFANPEVAAAYEKAKQSGQYDRVQCRDAEGNLSWDRAYAMTNAQEYFAESTEAYFGRNDFYPFIRTELKSVDPDMYALIRKVWGISA